MNSAPVPRTPSASSTRPGPEPESEAAGDHGCGAADGGGIPFTAVDRYFASHGPQVDPLLRMGAVLGFAGPAPTLAEVREHVGARVPFLPGLTFRAGGPDRRPTWEADPSFAVSAHVHERRVPGGWPSVDTLLAELVDTPFAETGPLWEVWLVHDRAGANDAFALVFRTHHTTRDGVGLVAALEALFGRRTPRAVVWPRPEPAIAAGTRELRFVTTGLGRWLRPGKHLPYRDGLRGERRIVSVCVPTSRLRAVSMAAGASWHQIHLAALTGALRAHTPDAFPAGSRPLFAAMPVSTRLPDEAEDALGNHLMAFRVPLPCGTADPVERLRRLQAATAGPRLLDVSQASRVFGRSLPVLGHWLGRTIMHPRCMPLLATSLHVRTPFEFAGRAPDAFALAPGHLPGHVLTGAMITCSGRVQTCFSVDTALSDADRLPHLWVHALTELESALAQKSASDPLR
ncbi:wax ester/triacylglycerol synthase domain-containing protein [Embleya sp. AB8]|uniref:wax ester/triacylglycerol synthase domain-containing protein n=1 Tax=Embleya sp. AB8 TaxID=3156304 RepID=UPI003C72FC05